MEILLILATAGGINLAAIGASAVYFKRLFIAEEKFHVLTDGGQVRVVQGKRRTPLKLSEAEVHLATVKKVAWWSGRQWVMSLWNLYGPKNTQRRDSELEVVQRHAVESQRNKLLVEAMNNGYEDTSVMATIMELSTDEQFKKLSEAVAKGEKSKTLAIATTLEANIQRESSNQNKEVVLISIDKVSTPKAISAPVKTGVSQGVALPEGYRWDIGWHNRGESYEEMVVLLKRANGKTIRSESFFTSVWSTEHEQRGRIVELQRKIALAARHDMDPSGISPEIRALL